MAHLILIVPYFKLSKMKHVLLLTVKRNYEEVEYRESVSLSMVNQNAIEIASIEIFDP